MDSLLPIIEVLLFYRQFVYLHGTVTRDFNASLQPQSAMLCAITVYWWVEECFLKLLRSHKDICSVLPFSDFVFTRSSNCYFSVWNRLLSRFISSCSNRNFVVLQTQYIFSFSSEFSRQNVTETRHSQLNVSLSSKLSNGRKVMTKNCCCNPRSVL